MSKPHLAGAKEQHYVPRFYLAGFSDNNLLSRLDRRNGRLSSRTPEHTARISNLYTFEDAHERRRYDIEVMFGHHEDRTAPIISKLVAGERISAGDREQLTAFIALAAVRTPAAIEEAKTVHVGFIKARLRAQLSDERRAFRWIQKLNDIGADKLRLKEEAAGVAKMVRTDSYLVEVDNEFALRKSLGNFGVIANSLIERDWMVLYASEKSEGFITTDHPVVLTTISSAKEREPLGYGSPHAQILFPIAHNCALVMSGIQGRTGRTDIKPEALGRFNRTVASYCHRYLFGRSREHLRSVADEIQLLNKPWRPNYTVESQQSPDGSYADVFVLRNGESPLGKPS